MKPSERSQVDPFIVMDVMEAAKAAEAKGHRVIHMEVGQPSTYAPIKARKAVKDLIDKSPMGYTVARGIPELRQGISKLYLDWYGLEIDPDRIIVTSGSSAGFLLAFTALFDAGANVGVGSPGYPSYRQILKALSLNPIGIPTSPQAGHQLRVEDVMPHRLDGLLVASPSNPTGTMLDYESLKSLAAFTKKSNISLISDEIYHGIEYEKKAVSVLELTDRAYVINSFSKFFSMTGWRIGWLIVPPDHVRTVECLAQNMFICPPHISQVAALAALDSQEEMKNNIKTYANNRRLMLDGLLAAGFTKITPPDGAFYIYVDISEFGIGSREFSALLLKKENVAITPGLDFDLERGGQTVRMSYAQKTSDIVEGLRRVKIFMDSYLYKKISSENLN
jgi:aspartate/methionine/tyrosine aminotransferase